MKGGQGRGSRELGALALFSTGSSTYTVLTHWGLDGDVAALCPLEFEVSRTKLPRHHLHNEGVIGFLDLVSSLDVLNILSGD